MPISHKVLESIRTRNIIDGALDLRPRVSSEVLNDEDVCLLIDLLRANNLNLKKMDLRYHDVGDKGVKALAQIDTLEEINLSNESSEYSDFGNEVTAIGALALSALPLLKKLNLSDNLIGDQGVMAFATHDNLVELTVIGCGISDTGLSALLIRNTRLKMLNVQRNNIQDLSAISHAVLQSLNVSYCHFVLTKEQAQFILQAKHLVDLNLENSRAEAQGVDILAMHSLLKVLNLTHCGINDAMVTVLSKNIVLRELRLSRNSITADGVLVLTGNSTLTHLYISDNEIQFDEACLHALLTEMKSLKVLCGDHNKISVEMVPVVELLMQGSSLVYLSLTQSSQVDFIYNKKRKLPDMSALESDADMGPELEDDLKLRLKIFKNCR
jgi:hypothetical protein